MKKVAEKIKVVHIITRMDKGGSAENTLLTAVGLQRRNYDVLLIKGLSLESGMPEVEEAAVRKSLIEAERIGVRLKTLPGLVRRIHPFKDVKTLLSLVFLLRRENPHIVHTHTSKAGILGRWAARIARVPVVIHTPHGHIFWGYFNGLVSRIYILLEQWTASVTDMIIPLTEQEKKEHLRAGIAPGYKFATIHSGVDLDRFPSGSADPVQIKKDMGIPGDSLVVGTAGRLTPIKGHRFFLEAAKEILAVRPDVFFLVLGHGELMDSLKEMSSRLRIADRVKFPGWRPDVCTVMSAFDVFVLPSLNEGMGRVIVEAMALGKPVVASSIGGILDLVKDGWNGLLVPAGDAGALAGAIIRLLRNPEERKTMGDRGKETAAYYSSDLMVREIDRLYVQLMENRAGAS